MSSARRPSPTFLLRCVVVTLSYFVTGRLGLLLSFSHGSVTPVWAPSGIAVAALHLLGLRAWPTVMLGAFLVNVSTGPTAAASVVIAIGNTLEGVVGAYLLRRLIGEDGRFDRLRDVVALAVVASVSAIVAALVGVLCLSVLGPRPVSPRDVALVWWSGDAIGILLVTSLVMTWLRPPAVARATRTSRVASLVEWGAVVTLAVVTTVSAFQRGIVHDDGLCPPLAFMPLPIVVWAAARLGTRGATTLTVLVATIAIARTSQWSPSASVALAQIAVLLTFIAIVSMSGLVVSAVVSAHAAAEASLERRHAQYAALVEALPDLIMRVARGGTVLDAHAPSGGALGVAEKELAGRPLSSVVPAALLDDVSPAIASGGSARVEAMWPAPGGGAARAVEVRVVPSGADEATLICRDVTELRDAQSKLVMADRLASIGTLAAGVAHEINNPLTFVGASLDLVERLHDADDPAQRAKVRGSIEAAKVGLDRIARIVRDLLRLARPQSDEGPLDLNATIDLAARMAQREIAPRARLVTNLAPPPRVRGSEARVGQVVLNLLVNAAQSLPDGAPDAHEIRVVTREADDGRAIIEVQDDGPGIPPDVLPHVFEPFFTTKPAGMGTGLGLSICQQILTSMGGEISIESAVGVGTTVRVVLPSLRSAP